MTCLRFRLAATCIAVVSAFATTASADVEVRGDGACVDLAALQTQVQSTLLAHKPKGAAEITIRIHFQRTDSGASKVSLVILLPDESLALEREYELTAQDCPSAGDLLVVVISDFLEELPAKHWSAPTQTETETKTKTKTETKTKVANVPASEHTISLALASAGLFALDTSNGETVMLAQAEVGAEVSLLAKTSWFVGLGLRGSTKHDLGAGSFRPMSYLADVGFVQGKQLTWGLRLRGGAVRVVGSGYDTNFRQWLPAAELGAQLGYQWRDWQVRAMLLATPVRHNITVENRDDVLSLPRFRLGLGIRYAIGRKKL